MTNPEIDNYGTKRWRNEKGELHREDGPAVISLNGDEYWRRNGKLHRENGPAIIYGGRGEIWYRNGKRHRENGPAVIFHNGDEAWCVNDKHIDIKSILERLDISPDWKSWSDEEKFLVRLALG